VHRLALYGRLRQQPFNLSQERTSTVFRSVPGILFMLLLAACATGAAEPASRSGDCLYALRLNSDRGRTTKWDSCNSPPAAAVKKIE